MADESVLGALDPGEAIVGLQRDGLNPCDEPLFTAVLERRYLADPSPARPRLVNRLLGYG